VWLMFNDSVPEFLDHINGNRTDNRIENLRPATRQSNKFNAHYQSECGVVGVSAKNYKCGTKYQATFRAKGYVGKRYLGLFKTKEEAHRAYVDAASNHYGSAFVLTSANALKKAD